MSGDVGQMVHRSASDTSATRNPSDSLMNVAAYPTSDTSDTGRNNEKKTSECEEPKVSSGVGQKVHRSASDTSAAKNLSDSLKKMAASSTSDTSDTGRINKKTDGQSCQKNEVETLNVSCEVGQEVHCSASDTSAAINPSFSLTNSAAYLPSDTSESEHCVCQLSSL